MNKLLSFSAVMAIGAGILMVVGGGMVLGGGWATLLTYQNVAREQIVTSDDAAIAEAPVRGPFTLLAQAKTIREHTLQMTNGKTYAQLSRDDEGREMWLTAITLTTALHLGVITYLFAGLVIVFGLISIWTGIVFWTLGKRVQ